MVQSLVFSTLNKYLLNIYPMKNTNINSKDSNFISRDTF